VRILTLELMLVFFFVTFSLIISRLTAILEIRHAGHQSDSEKVARSKDELS